MRRARASPGVSFLFTIAVYSTVDDTESLAMRAFAYLKTFAFLAAMALLAFPGSAGAEVIRLGGTGAGATALAAALRMLEPESGVSAEAVPSLGSAGGMRALQGGRIDLAVLGRPMTPDEATRGARVGAVFRTPFVLVTSRKAESAMTTAQIIDAFANPRARWPDGQPVTLILRQRSDGDAGLLNRMLPGLEGAVERARARPEVAVSTVDDNNADLAETADGSLASMSYSQFRMEKRKLQAIAIDGVAPSLEAYREGRYPHGRPFLVIVPASPRAATLRVLEVLQSERGAEVLRQLHCLLGPQS